MSDRRSFLRPVPILAAASLLVGLMASPTLAAPPSNDDRGDATVIGAVPYHDSIDTSEATFQATDPECLTGPGTPTVWYSFTPSESGRYRVDTSGSDYDTTLVVGTPNDGGLDIIDCNDDYDDITSTIIWRATAGQEYLIMAGECCDGGGSGGNLELNLRRAPRRVAANVTIDYRGIVNRMGGAVIRGHVSCRNGAGAGGEIEVRVTQTAGRFFIRGFGGAALRCNRDWRVRAPGNIGRFVPGKVTVRAEAFACNLGGCDNDTERRIVRLTAP